MNEWVNELLAQYLREALSHAVSIVRTRQKSLYGLQILGETVRGKISGQRTRA